MRQFFKILLSRHHTDYQIKFFCEMSTFKAIYFILVVEGQLCYNWDSINDDFIIFSPNYSQLPDLLHQTLVPVAPSWREDKKWREDYYFFLFILSAFYLFITQVSQRLIPPASFLVGLFCFHPLCVSVVGNLGFGRWLPSSLNPPTPTPPPPTKKKKKKDTVPPLISV